jgi:hypothetical protein
VRLALCAALALAGCAALPKPAPKPPPQPPRTIERVGLRVFDAPASAAPALEVRGLREADLASIESIREATRRLTGSSVALSGVATAEALLIPGFFSGSLVAGGLILAPLAIGLNAAEKRQHDAIVAALTETDLADAARAGLAKRLPPPSPGATLSVIVLAYGLVPKYAEAHGPLCLALDADIVLHDRGREVYRDTVYLEAWRRSADAPPPVCADMAAFAANDGAALRNAVLDYAQVLAAIVRQRTPALPWMP